MTQCAKASCFGNEEEPEKKAVAMRLFSFFNNDVDSYMTITKFRNLIVNNCVLDRPMRIQCSQNDNLYGNEERGIAIGFASGGNYMRIENTLNGEIYCYNDLLPTLNEIIEKSVYVITPKLEWVALRKEIKTVSFPGVPEYELETYRGGTYSIGDWGGYWGAHYDTDKDILYIDGRVKRKSGGGPWGMGGAL